MDTIEEYFSLSGFAHRALWKEGEPLWAPLRDLNDYLKTQVFQIEIAIPRGVYLDRPDLISIGKGTLIEPGVYIKGPCIIGKGSILRHGAYLRDCVICGDHSLIGHSAEVKHSILLNGSSVTHFCYVGDSIIGSGANLGAGVKCANLRLDRKEIAVTLSGKRVKTGLKKFGALVGDRVQIGCNSVLNPGTLVGKDTVSYPLLNLGGTIPQRSKMTGKQKVTRETRHKPLLDLMDKARVP
jgi:NDP-sugar pyrophosphorylase family protein